MSNLREVFDAIRAKVEDRQSKDQHYKLHDILRAVNPDNVVRFNKQALEAAGIPAKEFLRTYAIGYAKKFTSNPAGPPELLYARAVYKALGKCLKTTFDEAEEEYGFGLVLPFDMKKKVLIKRRDMLKLHKADLLKPNFPEEEKKSQAFRRARILARVVQAKAPKPVDPA